MVFKILIWILPYIYLVQCSPVRVIDQNLNNISKTCVNETGMDTNVLKNIMITGIIPQQSKTYLNFLECLYKKQNYFDEGGSISYSTIENYLSRYYDISIVKKALSPCESIQLGSTLGEKAYNAGKCIIGHLQALETKGVLGATETEQ
ncbi:hypothetical protein Trydic_g2039 [Trypoxylus dichotomus]